MNDSPILKYFGLALVIVLAVSFFYSNDSQPAEIDSTLKERSHIEELLKTNSSGKAYAIFKRENAKKSIIEQHTSAHLFGEVLYEKEGPAGFSVCDGDFGFGCFHTFISFAIADKGEGVVRELDQACVEQYGEGGLGCSHGIGHGLLSYYGYTIDDLLESLSVCGTLTWKHSYGGCQDGVFMEYNFRVMEPDPKDRTRPFSVDTRMEPCASVQESFLFSCYFSQPAWWLSAFYEYTDAVERAGDYCMEINSADSRQACFRGIGYAKAPDLGFDASKGVALCDSILAPLRERLWCREGYAWALYADPAFRTGAQSVCTLGLPISEALQCQKEYLFVIQ